MRIRGCPGCSAWTNKLTLVGVHLLSICTECDGTFMLDGYGKRRKWKPFNEEVLRHGTGHDERIGVGLRRAQK